MPLLRVEDLTKTFKGHASLFGRSQFNAVDSVSFTLERKQTLAIIGNNGSGKSTLVKMIAGIILVEFYLMIENYNIRMYNLELNIFVWFSKMLILHSTHV